MKKEIKYDNELIAIIFKCRDDKELNQGINFLTNPENPLQVGILNHPKGHVIPLHVHNYLERVIYETQEMLYVEKGKMKVSFCDNNKNKIGEEVLEEGDLVALLKKAHGMEMLKDSKIIYVKQGPYTGKKSDKRIL